MNGKARKPRIAVLTKQLDAWRSGSGHHMAQMMLHVLERNHDRFEFTFVHYKPSDNPIYGRVKELLIPRNPAVSSRAIERGGFDLVHYSPLTFYAPIWGVRARKVATMHGAEQLLLPRFHGPIELAHEAFLVPAYGRLMDGVLTVSQASKRFFVDRFRMRPERVVVAYNGLGPAYREMDAAEADAPERFGLRGPFVYHVSRFSERKNPWTLLEAFSRFVRSGGGRPHSLVCGGSGWDDPRVARAAARLGIADRLVLPGFISEEDSAQLMNRAEMLVFPSLAEGFGMPPTEAMACACPVVCTAAFAVKEVVGDAALVIEDALDSGSIAAAMSRIADEPGLAEELKKRGRARLPLYSWEKAADALLDLYERALSPTISAIAASKRSPRPAT
jgi:glycosyltransferase involved in cell wall biosynthesis